MLIRDIATFIAGSPRSGTTLMTSLMDNHPELLVFPEEYLHVHPRKTPEEGTRDVLDALFKEKVLLRLKGKKSILNDILNEDRKYDSFDYHGFENAVNGHFQLLVEKKDETSGMSIATLAFVSLIYGYAQAVGKRTYSRWVVKHPHYELHWQQVFNDFPKGKMIYMVRDPRDVILSRTLKANKKRFLKRGGKVAEWKSENVGLRPSIRFLREWETSINTFHCINGAMPENVILVRYEDLISSPRDVMGKVAEFLGVSWQESLVTPSFLGVPWKGNSMQERKFDKVESPVERKPHRLPKHHLWQIEAWLGEVMGRQPGAYYPLSLFDGIEARGLVSWLRGEGVLDFIGNRLRMLANQRKFSGHGAFDG